MSVTLRHVCDWYDAIVCVNYALIRVYYLCHGLVITVTLNSYAVMLIYNADTCFGYSLDLCKVGGKFQSNLNYR